MEVKIYYPNGLDSHMIPPYVGSVSTQTDEKAVTDTTLSESDNVAEIVERVRVTENGVFLERYKRVIAPDDAYAKRGVFYTNGSKSMCIVDKKRMPSVLRVCVDGEQIWPEIEEEDISEDLVKLQEVVGQLAK